MPDTFHIPTFEKHEFSAKLNKYCIIVGILNEGEKFKKQLHTIQEYTRLVDVIIADGGSTDGATTADYVRDKVRTLLVKTGTGGLSAQYRMALYYALNDGYAGIITVDGNNKDGMEAIPRFVQALEEGYDLVQGSRFMPGGSEENTPWDRKFAIRCIHSPLMSLASGYRYTDSINGFKGFSRRYLLDARVKPFREIFNCYNLQYYLNYRAPRLKFKVTEIPVSRKYPGYGLTPTKISGLRGRISILNELFQTLVGRFNP